MTFDEIVAEVISITKRPDLSSRIQSAVRAATLKAHHTNYFSKDLGEVAVEFGTAEYVQTFQPNILIPSYRAPKYLRRWDGDAAGYYSGATLSSITIDNFKDGYGYEKTDVWYIAGNNLQIRNSTPLQYFVFGFYAHPVVATSAEFRSWIATEYPWAIINEAARSIFASIGFQEQASEYRNLVSEQYRLLLVSAGADMEPT